MSKSSPVIAALVIALGYGNTWAGMIEALPIVAGEVGYSSAAAEWTTQPLAAGDLAALSSGSANIHLESGYFCYAPPTGYLYHSPEVIVWFDASGLVEGANISLALSASVLDRNGVTDCLYQVYHFSYGWYGGDTWDTGVSPQAVYELERGGYGPPPFYWVTADNRIGIRLGAMGSAGGGGLPITEVYTLDVQEIRIMGEVVPEPVTVSLLTFGGLVVLRRRRDKFS
ncbi:MAG: PEP-CTERM sorting domain-containing protein [Phycisphaerae bacterium]|nr:PEP-CTERM sorting domain-containing protein [Phycisphaerae bacterium]